MENGEGKCHALSVRRLRLRAIVPPWQSACSFLLLLTGDRASCKRPFGGPAKATAQEMAKTDAYDRDRG